MAVDDIYSSYRGAMRITEFFVYLWENGALTLFLLRENGTRRRACQSVTEAIRNDIKHGVDKIMPLRRIISPGSTYSLDNGCNRQNTNTEYP